MHHVASVRVRRSSRRPRRAELSWDDEVVINYSRLPPLISHLSPRLSCVWCAGRKASSGAWAIVHCDEPCRTRTGKYNTALVRMWRIFDHCWPDCHRPCLLLVGGQQVDLLQWPVGRESSTLYEVDPLRKPPNVSWDAKQRGLNVSMNL